MVERSGLCCREIELRIRQANRARQNPQRLKEYFDRSRANGDDTSDLERRMERLEQKLDELLNLPHSRQEESRSQTLSRARSSISPTFSCPRLVFWRTPVQTCLL